jgi:hypothetical protein
MVCLSLHLLRNRQHFLCTIYLITFYTFEIHTKITWVSSTLSKLSTVLNRTVNMPLCFAYKQLTWSVIITPHPPYSTSPEKKTIVRMQCINIGSTQVPCQFLSRCTPGNELTFCSATNCQVSQTPNDCLTWNVHFSFLYNFYLELFLTQE